MAETSRYLLSDDQVPTAWYNVIPDLPGDFPPIKTLELYQHNLPAQMTSFIGRAQELEDVSRILSAERLLTLTGPGGIGKTRLIDNRVLRPERLHAFTVDPAVIRTSWMERTAYLASDAVIAVSAGMRDDVLTVFPELDPDRVHVAPHGVSVPAAPAMSVSSVWRTPFGFAVVPDV